MPPTRFEDIFDRQKLKLFRLALRILGNSSEAEDVVQESFIRLFRQFDDFPSDDDAISWVCRVVMNLCTDHIRHRNRWRFFEPKTDDPTPHPLDTIPETDLPHDIVMEKTELTRHLREALSRLSEKYRQVLILREMEGLSYEEIARLLKITPETVGVRLIRSKIQLKSKMKKYL
jgi:RNA polymerase sigma-70 factor, ECF subfamily